jgi:predicted enzyme involved in methoxymalonyl-ACP biosynthesis
MSCRVISRQIESAFLGALLSKLQSRGVRSVIGLFKPTEKNAVASKMYGNFGFTPTDAWHGFEAWQMQLEDLTLPISRVVHIQWSDEKC